MKKQLWAPSESWIQNANITHYEAWVNEHYGKDFHGYWDLYKWSVNAPCDFWDSIWDYFDLIGDKPAGSAQKSHLEWRKSDWFPGAKLNYTENMLRYLDTDEEKMVFHGEDKVKRSLSGKEIRREVYQLARALQKAGVKEGEVVAGYLPNLPETIIAMLAAAAIGAVWCSCATDIGPIAAVDRIGQTKPVLLITTDGYYYKGKLFDTLPKAKVIAEGIPSVQKIVVVHYAGDSKEISTIPNAVSWETFLEGNDDSEISYQKYPFSQPLVIMFSSGTTGKPKCMVQSAMGLLLNQLKELAIMSDLQDTDRMLYITTCSWMMWNWNASALALGTTLVLYDGNPSWPDTGAIWRVLEEEKVTVFGLSASYIHALVREKYNPDEHVDLSYLREISQTGSALSDAGFDFVYEHIKKDLFFNSIAGGTDINGCFAIGSPIRPVYSDELQGPGLGMKINCYDLNGKAVRDEEGELVCELPEPSMPLYFWNDPDGKRYEHAYFDVYPGIWRHGDFVSIDSKTGGITFHGRSDSVLKPSGVRIGTSEIYNIVESLDEIKESLAVGQDYHGDQRVILFVQLKDGYTLDDALVKKIKTSLRTKASPRHVPSRIFAVHDIPHTLNGKKVESAVTNILNHRAVTNRNALGNPDSLDEYETIGKEQLSD
jgi:acetoacetyl-CoA synthetase